jgi:uncharacterized membrane protein
VSAAATLPAPATPVAAAPAARPRLPEIDLIRGLSVGMMIVVHTLLYFATAETQRRGLGHVILVLGKATATFVVCLGVSFSLSRRQALGDALRRGVRLLAYGYALNFCKFLLPLYVFRTLPTAFLLDMGLRRGDPANLRFLLLLGDILHLAGLSTLVLAGLRCLRVGPLATLGLAAAVALAAPLLWGLRTAEPVTAYLCDLLFGQTYTVFFPLFPWLAYALVGLALGDAYRLFAGQPRRFYRWVGGGGLLALGAGLLLGWAYPATWHGVDFYRTGPAGVFALSGATGLLFVVFRGLAPRLPAVVLRGCAFLSRHVTALYALSWVAIYWNMGWLGFLHYSDSWQLLGVVAYILLLTLAAHRGYLLVKRYYSEQQ